MAKKSRKQKRSHMRRRSHRRGGMAPIDGGMDNYSTKASLGHGMDYFKYHEGQHGGEAPLSAIGSEMLPSNLHASAGIGALNRAMEQIAGMRDQTGGRRKSRKSKKSKKSKKSRRTGKKRGGALGSSPFPFQGMILDGGLAGKAGLNPEWQGGLETEMAARRNAM